MKVYLIGPAGLFNERPEQLNYLVQLYGNATAELEKQGYDVINIMQQQIPTDKKEEIPFRLGKMLECKKVFVLPGCEKDPVAKLEIIAAGIAEMKFTYAR